MLDIPLQRGNERPAFLAFYLPQFHPIPENNKWWGEGFTEWTNVVQGRPRFRGHYQPHIPADLGFYDLRLADTRQAQADLAASHGVDGFCYYHYWFNGHRLLGGPLDAIRSSGKPDFPFCLCWANENWTRGWDGSTHSVLMRQDYNEKDDREHGRWLTPIFADQRYIHIDGRPLFLVYRASLLPDSRRTTEIWREEAVRAGLPEPFICCVESNFPTEGFDPTGAGFDAAVEFQPDWRLVHSASVKAAGSLARRLGVRPPPPKYFRVPYDRVVRRALARPQSPYIRFPCVSPSWDNTPRRKRGAVILDGSTPQSYGRWVEEVASSTPYGLVFVNAWNEWGEGCHLEPDRKWGRAYLQAHRDALSASPEQLRATS